MIGICGGTGSCKTTIAHKVINSVGAERVILLNQDSYYRDLSALPLDARSHANFDHPDSLDFELLIDHAKKLLSGEAIEQPIYDFTTHTRTKESLRIEPQPVIILEGILILTQPALRDLIDMKIFIEADADIRFIRRLLRDISERGRTKESVIHQYLTSVRPMHAEYVEPTKQYADIIIPKGGDNHIGIDMINAWVRQHLSLT